MKKTIILLTMVCFLFSCNNNVEDIYYTPKIEAENKSSLLLKKEIQDVIKDYISQNKRNSGIAYKLIILNGYPDVKFNLSSSISLSGIFSNDFYPFPTGYFRVNNKVVVYYTGLEMISNRDTAFCNDLKKILLDDSLYMDINAKYETVEGALYHPENWLITLRRDSIIINRDAEGIIQPTIKEEKSLPMN